MTRPRCRSLCRRCVPRGFTLLEVMLAVGLLGVVGAGIVTFLGAFASGSDARARVSDPALEATLAVRRLGALAPDFRTVLAADEDEAVLWLSDRVPSRTVHLSELGCLRVDAARGELLFETVDHAALAADRSLETEFAARDHFLAAIASAREAGIVRVRLLAEGLDSAAFRAAESRHAVVLEVGAAGTTSGVVISPAHAEEPLR
jgi:prepilin-type N-terminal cleavage/methylation domain-containing protein